MSFTFEELNWRRHEAKRLRTEAKATVYRRLLTTCYRSHLDTVPSPSRRLDPRDTGAINETTTIQTTNRLISNFRKSEIFKIRRKRVQNSSLAANEHF